VDVEHIDITKMFEEEVKKFIERKKIKTTNKGNIDCIWWVNFYFFSIKKDDVPHKEFLEDFGFFYCQ
jgi:hypothetical protein